MHDSIFEITKSPYDKNNFCVVINNFDELELFILFEGAEWECDRLLYNLKEAESKGFFDQKDRSGKK